VTTDRQESVEALQAKNTDLCANILKESGKKADVNYVWQDKKNRAIAHSSDKDQNVSTKELYEIAKGFLKTFAE
jgi:hypothetical protein